MASFNWYELPPDKCERCGDKLTDIYCRGEIVFDDGDTVPVCDWCADDWFSCYSVGPDGKELVDPEKAAEFQRRGVESPPAQSLRESRERRAAEQSKREGR